MQETSPHKRFHAASVFVNIIRKYQTSVFLTNSVKPTQKNHHASTALSYIACIPKEEEKKMTPLRVVTCARKNYPKKGMTEQQQPPLQSYFFFPLDLVKFVLVYKVA